MSDVAEAPSIVAEPVTDDHRLVAAVRRGDDRAFEALYERYQRRIHAYVLGMVKDHGRAEDVTQEVFVSALRRMRETERPIAFKPWIYEIAKNACIDQFRRSRRAEEVSIDADEGLAPADYGKLVGSEPTPDAAVAVKQDLDHLCGAFDEVSDTHHQILVLRELEGLSYREIGDRMGMSRPAVESTLFRARRRLTEEYDELVTGARCRRVQVLIETAVEARLGARESNRLSRHVAHCQGCRRVAIEAGLDSSFLTYVPVRRRAAAKVAALLPFPIFGRGRGRGAGGDAAASVAGPAGGSGSGWLSQLPLLSDQLAAPWAKLAVIAILVAGAGATGVGTHGPAESRGAAVAEDGSDRAAQERRDARDRAGETASRVPAPAQAKSPSSRADANQRDRDAAAGGDRSATRTEPRDDGGGGGPSQGGTRDAAPIPATTAPGGTDAVTRQVTDTADAGPGETGLPDVPKVEMPATTSEPADAVAPVEEAVREVAEPVLNEAAAPAPEVTAPVTDAVEPVTGAVEDATGVSLP